MAIGNASINFLYTATSNEMILFSSVTQLRWVSFQITDPLRNVESCRSMIAFDGVYSIALHQDADVKIESKLFKDKSLNHVVEHFH